MVSTPSACCSHGGTYNRSTEDKRSPPSPIARSQSVPASSFPNPPQVINWTLSRPSLPTPSPVTAARTDAEINPQMNSPRGTRKVVPRLGGKDYVWLSSATFPTGMASNCTNYLLRHQNRVQMTLHTKCCSLLEFVFICRLILC